MPNTIADNLQRLVNAKGAIASAITNRGGTVGSSDGLEDFASDIAAIPNTYAAGDEGKVVQNGVLVLQTSTSVSQNGTINTTTNNSVAVNVENSYTQADEGKVVSNGALVAQGSDTVTENGTVDTTLISSLLVIVPSSSNPEAYPYYHQGIILSSTCGVYFGGNPNETSKLAAFIYLNLPETFPVEKIGSTIFGYCKRGSSIVNVTASYNSTIRRIEVDIPSTSITYTGRYYMVMFNLNTTD